jgi:hypothetical protein
VETTPENNMPRAKSKSGGVTIRDAVREVLDEKGMDTKPLQIQKLIKDKHHLDVSPNLISNYKSFFRSKAGLPRSRAGRRRKARASNGRHAGRKGAAGREEVRIEDLRALRDMAGRIGPSRLRELVDFLAE